MNELIACSDYDDGICRPSGDVCPLQIEDQHSCVNRQSEEEMSDKTYEKLTAEAKAEFERLGYLFPVCAYCKKHIDSEGEEPPKPSQCPHRGSRRKAENLWWCIVWQMWCGATVIAECTALRRTLEAYARYLSPEQVDAVKAEAVKKAIEEFQVEVFPALIGMTTESECQKRIDDAVKAETKRVVLELDRYHTSSIQWLALRKKLLGIEETSAETPTEEKDWIPPDDTF